MQNLCATSAGPSACAGMALQCLWLVDEDARYRCNLHRGGETGVVIIRTLAGEGVIEVAGQGRHALRAGTVFLAEIACLREYGTVGDRWHFAWFEVAREGVLAYPWHEVLNVMEHAWEEALILRVFHQLALPDLAARTAASALCNAVLHEWAAGWQRNGARPDPRRELVRQAITRMQHDLASPIGLDTLAADLGISTRWLRRAFLTVTGFSPKAYYTDLRLQHAAQALAMGHPSITVLAERLGYASPYHFSRAFKAKYGISPSRYGACLKVTENHGILA